VGEGRSWARAVKRVLTWGRIVARRSGAARHAFNLEARKGREGGSAQRVVVAARAAKLGSRPIHGCTCSALVAEVGEKHLLRSAEGSREANRGEAGKRRWANPNP